MKYDKLQIKDLISKYSKFSKTQEVKMTFICDILNCFRSEFILLEPKDATKYRDYLTNIYNNISMIQDIIYICRDEIADFALDNQIDCISFAKIVDIKASLEVIANNKCDYCLTLIESCFRKIL